MGGQEQQQYQEQAPPSPRTRHPAAGRRRRSDMDTKLAQLKELGELKEQGILSDAEFEVQKDRILNG